MGMSAINDEYQTSSLSVTSLSLELLSSLRVRDAGAIADALGGIFRVFVQLSKFVPAYRTLDLIGFNFAT